LDFDDRARLLEFARQPRVARLQLRDAPLLGTERCLAAAPTCERGQGADLALPPPRRQMRAVQPFPAQQCSHRARIRAAIGFLQHRQLVRGAELPAPGHRAHLRVRCTTRPRPPRQKPRSPSRLAQFPPRPLM
jgi:hypothetical protein